MNTNLKKSYILALSLILCIYCNHQLFGQKILFHQDKIVLNVKDSLEGFFKMDSILNKLHLEGYLAASIDSFYFNESALYISLWKGHQYQFGRLDHIQSDSLVDWSLFRNQSGSILDFDRLRIEAKKIIDSYNNLGYPFASIVLDSFAFDQGVMHGVFEFKRGKRITFDSLTLVGERVLSQAFLSQFLQIESGSLFDQRKFQTSASKLRNLDFVKLKKTPSLQFVNDKAVVTLALDKAKSNRFDFLIGLLQNPADQNTSSYTITGSLTMELINTLRAGEILYLKLERLRPEVQELELGLEYPFFLNTPFGIHYDFDVFRNRDSNIDVFSKLGLSFQVKLNQQLDVNWQLKSSRLLEIDTASLLIQKILPENIDIRYNSLGIGYKYQNLDYKFNPSRGSILEVNIAGGQRKILKNSRITELINDQVDFSTAYDTLNLEAMHFTFTSNFSHFFPLSNNIILMYGNNSSWMYSNENLYSNDLFRIGGFNSIRGFDEQSLRSSFYCVNTLELRFILAQQANNFSLSLPFIDFAYDYNPLRLNSQKWDNPIGVGLAMNFETTAGLFNFAIASGKRLRNNFDFGSLKIHFGYKSIF